LAQAKQAHGRRGGACFAPLSGFTTVFTHIRHMRTTNRRGNGVRAMASVLRNLLRDENGQDVIEYGLLSAFFGIVAIVAWLTIQARLEAAYRNYDTDVQNIWQSPDPGGS
jgi:Flp pilus assembly pilin Flp